ncbi:AVAST type 1 anti-phage system MBL fold metallo-hydrolase Avs1a [Rheinheimera oceanensis]|uniref:AVAST type 1 anti-phage system MBL fold metallo-hydrolase Avs1a n=1 Tax=Rheinheimera oceanensis TaxID=2817449 RepID=UPI001BFE7DEA|nr:AVAST type 1 anti-phage system MBL fold metallo-hydrolase Avs1a [Rheinheimera oceanensis]
MMKIKMYPACNGDAFLIKAARSNILVDAGYAQTFDNYISTDLLDLSYKGEKLDLVIVSHIDADHISGIIKFLSINGTSAVPKLISIGDVWHNSLRSLSSAERSEINASDRAILKAICQRGHPIPNMLPKPGATEISARQGSSLASLIHQGGYKWNCGDGTSRIKQDFTKVHHFSGGSVRVIGPRQERLDGLLKWWKRRLLQIGYNGPTGPGEIIDDAFEFICEHAAEATVLSPTPLSAGGRKLLEDVYEPDVSITNGSSITVIVELDGVRVLMLADAWAEDVIDALRVLQSQGDSMMFDAIKISHHGSLRNTSPELLKLIDAPVYMVSSNGTGHGHPNVEVLTAIVDRPAAFSRTVYLNYSTDASSILLKHQSRSKTPFTVHENMTDWIPIGRT